MTVINRINRLLKADLHGILDSLEEPESILKQALRDMESEIEKGESELSKKKAKKKTLKTMFEERQRTMNDIERQIDLCLEAENEQLARTLVRKKLELGKKKGVLEQAIASCEGEVESLSTRLEEQQEKLESIKEKAEVLSESFACREEVAQNQCEEGLGLDEFRITDEDVEIALLEEKKRRQAELGAGG